MTYLKAKYILDAIYKKDPTLYEGIMSETINYCEDSREDMLLFEVYNRNNKKLMHKLMLEIEQYYKKVNP